MGERVAMHDATARDISPDIATAYLAREVAGNVEAIISLAHDYFPRALGVWRDDRLAGVLVAGREWPTGPATARVAADNTGALHALLAAFPPDIFQISVAHPWMLPLLTARFALAAVPYSAHVFLTASAVVAPPQLSAVRPLTWRDAAVVAASATPWGRDGFEADLAEGFRPLGIIEGQRLIARAMASFETRWSEEVTSVWTAPRHRGRGLATAVVAAVATDILTRRPLATYAARSDNAASLRVAEKAGFRRSHESVTYTIGQ